jgi:tetratricopeptide (TPR) repeat protein
MTKLYLLILVAFLTACGSPAPRLPSVIQQAHTLDKEARRAQQTGDLLRAHYNFTKLLALQQSVDDTAAVAITQLNLATVAYQLQDQPAAFAWLDKIILEQAGVYPKEARLTAYFRKAVFLANAQKLTEATLALQSAENLCEQKCAEYFGLKVLQARLLLLNGDAKNALALATELSKQSALDNSELANVIRIQAAAEEKLALNTASFKHYQSALEMDKKLALTSRITEDLLGLSRVANTLGQADEAILYSRRAALLNDSKVKTIPVKADQK